MLSRTHARPSYQVNSIPYGTWLVRGTGGIWRKHFSLSTEGAVRHEARYRFGPAKSEHASQEQGEAQATTRQFVLVGGGGLVHQCSK